MRFESLRIAGAKLVRIEPSHDARGFFARTYCEETFVRNGVPGRMVQASVSFNRRRGTVRGLHFQWPPSAEGKLVRCIRGQLFDVLLDLRPQSSTYLQHETISLDEDNRDAVFIPPGIAHGFQTLVDGTEILYQMTDVYVPELQAGVRWSDPQFGIQWPLADVVISERDAAYPDFSRATYEEEFARRQGAPRGPGAAR